MVVNFLRMTCSLTAVFFFVASAQGATLYVDADAPGPADGMTWATAFTNPQHALAIAVAGDDIYVAQGTYMPNGARVGDSGYVAGDLEAVPFQLINGVRIMGGYAGFGEAEPDHRDVPVYETIFSGDLTNNDVPVICTSRAHCRSYGYRCTNGFCILKDQILPFVENIVTGHGTDVTAVLDGVTVSDGFSSSGSGMRNNSGSPTVSNCTFTGNHSDSAGAGMYNIESSPTVTNCKFIGNFAFGAGAGISNVNSSAATTLITDCIFSDNVSFFGAGIRNLGPRDIESTSTLRITNCIFNQNDVTPLGAGHGGGMHNSGYAVAIVSNCLFIGNTAKSGGGLANSGLVNRTNGSVTLTNCAFIGNSAISQGGGIYSATSETTTLINCLFSGNTASVGGGLYEDGIFSSDTSVTNCTFSGNTALQAAGGIYVQYDASPLKLNNCILFAIAQTSSPQIMVPRNFPIVI